MKKEKRVAIGGKVPTGSRIPKDPEKFGQTYHYCLRLILGRIRRKGFRAVARQVNLSHTTLENLATDPERAVSRETKIKIIRLIVKPYRKPKEDPSVDIPLPGLWASDSI